jgi:hypothetical protein
MGLAFPGWEKPGVMGATAAERLASRYGALEARRAIVLGTTTESLLAARAMQRAGVTVAALVEQEPAPRGPAALVTEIGAPVLTRHMITGAEGGADGVTGASLVKLDPAGHRVAGSGVVIDCDTIVLGVGAIPVIELLDAIGCRSAFMPERGGYVPVLDATQTTSVAGVYAVGDCAGVWMAKSLDRAIAEAEGARAAAHVVAQLTGTAVPKESFEMPEPVGEAAFSDYVLGWVRGAVVDATGAPYVCQCEEVTARDILEVRPPRYLGWDRPPRNDVSLASLLGDGPPNPDQVKRLTRAGMGVCQGRRCRDQVAALLALGGGVKLGGVPMATHRAPVRPIPLGLAGTLPESAAMAEHWHVWFGIPGHVDSYWDIKPARDGESA